MKWSATLDAITLEAKSLSPVRILITLITLPFFMLGWLIGLVFTCGALLYSAGVVGFREARHSATRPRGESQKVV